MNDRVHMIIGTPAAAAFPALAAFLANSTQIAPNLAEAALRAACKDYSAAENAADVKAGWQRATEGANASRIPGGV